MKSSRTASKSSQSGRKSARPHSAAQRVKQILAGTELPDNLLIICPDRIRKERIIQLCIEKFSDKKWAQALSEGRLSRIDARELDEQSMRLLRQDTATLSLFSTQRFFIIDHIEELPAALVQALLKIISAPNAGNKYILTAAALPASHAISKFFNKIDCLIQLDELRGVEFQRWIERELAREGLQASTEAIGSLIIDLAEGSPDRAVKLIEQLSLFVREPHRNDSARVTPISEEELFNIFSYHPSAGEFQFIDTMTQGKPMRSEFLSRQLISSGKNPFGISALAARTFLQLFAAKSLLAEGHLPSVIQERLGLTPWLLKKYMGIVRGYSEERLAHALRALLRADSKLKNKSLGAEAIIGETVWQLSPQGRAV